MADRIPVNLFFLGMLFRKDGSWKKVDTPFRFQERMGEAGISFAGNAIHDQGGNGVGERIAGWLRQKPSGESFPSIRLPSLRGGPSIQIFAPDWGVNFSD